MTLGDGEDVDIYSDLSNFNISDTIRQLEALNVNLQKQVKELKVQLFETAKEKEKLEADNKTLTTNISSLFKTAKAELERKNKTILELRSEYNNVLFRRNKTGRTQVSRNTSASYIVNETKDKQDQSKDNNVSACKKEWHYKESREKPSPAEKSGHNLEQKNRVKEKGVRDNIASVLRKSSRKTSMKFRCGDKNCQDNHEKRRHRGNCSKDVSVRKEFDREPRRTRSKLSQPEYADKCNMKNRLIEPLNIESVSTTNNDEVEINSNCNFASQLDYVNLSKDEIDYQEQTQEVSKNETTSQAPSHASVTTPPPAAMTEYSKRMLRRLLGTATVKTCSSQPVTSDNGSTKHETSRDQNVNSEDRNVFPENLKTPERSLLKTNLTVESDNVSDDNQSFSVQNKKTCFPGTVSSKHNSDSKVASKDYNVQSNKEIILTENMKTCSQASSSNPNFSDPTVSSKDKYSGSENKRGSIENKSCDQSDDNSHCKDTDCANEDVALKSINVGVTSDISNEKNAIADSYSGKRNNVCCSDVLIPISVENMGENVHSVNGNLQSLDKNVTAKKINVLTYDKSLFEDEDGQIISCMIKSDSPAEPVSISETTKFELTTNKAATGLTSDISLCVSEERQLNIPPDDKSSFENQPPKCIVIPEKFIAINDNGLYPAFNVSVDLSVSSSSNSDVETSKSFCEEVVHSINVEQKSYEKLQEICEITSKENDNGNYSKTDKSADFTPDKIPKLIDETGFQIPDINATNEPVKTSTGHTENKKDNEVASATQEIPCRDAVLSSPNSLHDILNLSGEKNKDAQFQFELFSLDSIDKLASISPKKRINSNISSQETNKKMMSDFVSSQPLTSEVCNPEEVRSESSPGLQQDFNSKLNCIKANIFENPVKPNCSMTKSLDKDFEINPSFEENPKTNEVSGKEVFPNLVSVHKEGFVKVSNKTVETFVSRRSPAKKKTCKNGVKTVINPISSLWTQSLPRNELLKTVTEKKKSEQMLKVDFSGSKTDLLQSIFGSPIKWADSDSLEFVPPSIEKDPLSFEDSGSGLDVVKVNVRSTLENASEKSSEFYSGSNKKQVATISSNNKVACVEKIIPSVVTDSSDHKLNSAKVSAALSDSPLRCVRYEDTTLGQFEDTLQFVSALSVVKQSVSPISTPEKVVQERFSNNDSSQSFPSMKLNQKPEFKIVGPNEKPINVLIPRKTPRMISPEKSKACEKSPSSSDSRSPRTSTRLSCIDDNSFKKVCDLVPSFLQSYPTTAFKLSKKPKRNTSPKKSDHSLSPKNIKGKNANPSSCVNIPLCWTTAEVPDSTIKQIDSSNISPENFDQLVSDTKNTSLDLPDTKKPSNPLNDEAITENSKNTPSLSLSAIKEKISVDSRHNRVSRTKLIESLPLIPKTSYCTKVRMSYELKKPSVMNRRKSLGSNEISPQNDELVETSYPCKNNEAQKLGEVLINSEDKPEISKDNVQSNLFCDRDPVVKKTTAHIDTFVTYRNLTEIVNNSKDECNLKNDNLIVVRSNSSPNSNLPYDKLMSDHKVSKIGEQENEERVKPRFVAKKRTVVTDRCSLSNPLDGRDVDVADSSGPICDKEKTFQVEERCNEKAIKSSSDIVMSNKDSKCLSVGVEKVSSRSIKLSSPVSKVSSMDISGIQKKCKEKISPKSNKELKEISISSSKLPSKEQHVVPPKKINPKSLRINEFSSSSSGLHNLVSSKKVVSPHSKKTRRSPSNKIYSSRHHSRFPINPSDADRHYNRRFYQNEPELPFRQKLSMRYSCYFRREPSVSRQKPAHQDNRRNRKYSPRVDLTCRKEPSVENNLKRAQPSPCDPLRNSTCNVTRGWGSSPTVAVSIPRYYHSTLQTTEQVTYDRFNGIICNNMVWKLFEIDFDPVTIYHQKDNTVECKTDKEIVSKGFKSLSLGLSSPSESVTKSSKIVSRKRSCNFSSSEIKTESFSSSPSPSRNVSPSFTKNVGSKSCLISGSKSPSSLVNTPNKTLPSQDNSLKTPPVNKELTAPAVRPTVKPNISTLMHLKKQLKSSKLSNQHENNELDDSSSSSENDNLSETKNWSKNISSSELSKSNSDDGQKSSKDKLFNEMSCKKIPSGDKMSQGRVVPSSKTPSVFNKRQDKFTYRMPSYIKKSSEDEVKTVSVNKVKNIVSRVCLPSRDSDVPESSDVSNSSFSSDESWVPKRKRKKKYH